MGGRHWVDAAGVHMSVALDWWELSCGYGGFGLRLYPIFGRGVLVGSIMLGPSLDARSPFHTLSLTF